MRVSVLYVLCFLWGVEALSAQQPDTVYLPVAHIEAHRYKLFAAGSYWFSPDSMTGELFRHQMLAHWPLPAIVHVRNYGPGGIATVSLRGMEPRHTSVIWNGIPVNSPSLGLSDLGVLPLSPFARFQIYPGSASALFHTGSSGGALSLSEEISYGKKRVAYAGVEQGSFGYQNIATGFQLSGNRLYQSAALLFQRARNDFPFINTALYGSPKQKQVHAAESHGFITGHSSWKMTLSDELSAAWWFQYSQRQIPPLMTQSVSKAWIKDSLLNAMLQYKKLIRKSMTMQLKSAWLANQQHYTDSLARIDAIYKWQTLYQEATATMALSSSLLMQAGMVYSHTWFQFKEYGKSKHLEQYSFFNSLRMEKSRWVITAGIRNVYRHKKLFPWNMHAGSTVHLSPRITLRGRLYSSYQFPTANDLYWQPGGNPDLKPEHTVGAETGADLLLVKNLQFSITVYRNHIRHWIQWLPSLSGIYTPQNISRVLAQGAESSFRLPVTSGKLSLEFSGSCVYNYSVMRAGGFPVSEETENKQLIYIPRYAAQGSALLSYHPFSLWLHYHYTGIRYTTADHSYYLPAYHLFHLAVQAGFRFKAVLVQTQVRLGNVLDASYQSVAWRAMPGRQVVAGLLIRFHSSTSVNP
jgi:iron complex outermembrane receptor protein